MSIKTVIVGAGSAGGALAARLTEDPEQDVVLIEAGPDYPDLERSRPTSDAYEMSVDSHDWGLRRTSSSPPRRASRSPTRAAGSSAAPRRSTPRSRSARRSRTSSRGSPPATTSGRSTTSCPTSAGSRTTSTSASRRSTAATVRCRSSATRATSGRRRARVRAGVPGARLPGLRGLQRARLDRRRLGAAQPGRRRARQFARHVPRRGARAAEPDDRLRHALPARAVRGHARGRRRGRRDGVVERSTAIASCCRRARSIRRSC